MTGVQTCALPISIVHKLKFNPGRAGGANLLPSSSGEFILLLVLKQEIGRASCRERV